MSLTAHAIHAAQTIQTMLGNLGTLGRRQWVAKSSLVSMGENQVQLPDPQETSDIGDSDGSAYSAHKNSGIEKNP